jgi:hypothetical protein
MFDPVIIQIQIDKGYEMIRTFPGPRIANHSSNKNQKIIV